MSKRILHIQYRINSYLQENCKNNVADPGLVCKIPLLARTRPKAARPSAYIKSWTLDALQTSLASPGRMKDYKKLKNAHKRRVKCFLEVLYG